MGNYGSRIINGTQGEYDRAGYSVSGIGDFNGDGIDDFAITEQRGSNDYYNSTGAVYIVYGVEGTDDGSSPGAELEIDLADLDGTNGFKIQSDQQVSDYNYNTTFGHSIVALGDVNNDGAADFAIVENATEYVNAGYYGYYGGYYYNYTPGAGVAYVIYGQQDAPLDDAGALADTVNVDELDHFRIDVNGILEDVVALDDVNGDGIADIGVVSSTSSRQSVYSYYLYDANGNGYYDEDGNEFVNSYNRSFNINDVQGYVVYGTDDSDPLTARTGSDPVADGGGSSVIVNADNLDVDEGMSFGLGQTFGGGGFYGGEGGFEGEFGVAAFASDSIGGGNNNGYYVDEYAGIDGTADLNGDGFADVVTRSGGVYVQNITRINDPNGSYTYDGGAFGYGYQPVITDGDDQSETTLNLAGSFGVQSDRISILGNFSGDDAAEEIAITGFGRQSEASELPNSFTQGVFVVNGRSDLLDSSSVSMNIITDGATGTNGSFFYSTDTYDNDGVDRTVVNSIQGVLGIGDVNGDGIDDMLILAQANDLDLFTHYRTYVVLGTEAARVGLVDLDALVDSGGAYVVISDDENDLRDMVISAAGDVDGDDNADIILGFQNDNNGNGAAAIIHGGLDVFEAADNADGADDNTIQLNNFLVDVDTGLVPIELSIQEQFIQQISEGDTGTTVMTFTVERSGDLTAAVTVDFEVTGGGVYSFDEDAEADDFEGGVFPTGTVTFAEGEATATFEIPIAGDTTNEDDNDFTVALLNPTTDNDAPLRIVDNDGRGRILNDDVPVDFRIFNVSSVEGDPGDDAQLRMIVYRSGKTDVEASVDWTATIYSSSPTFSAEDEDLEGGLPQSGTVTFAAGETQKDILLPIAEDTEIEINEYVQFTLSNASRTDGLETTISRPSGIAFINNDDFPVQFSVNDPFVTEGDGDTVDLVFTVTRSGITDADATVDFRLAHSSTNNDDFTEGFLDPATGQPREGTLSFAAGETEQTVVLKVAGDSLDEFTEFVSIFLTNPTTTDSNAPQIIDSFGSGRIFDDDDSVEYSVNNSSVTEGDEGDDRSLTFTVFRGGITDVAGTVDYSISGFLSTAANDDDFTTYSDDDVVDGDVVLPLAGTLEFAANETSKTITMVVQGDSDAESTEYVQILLSNPTAENGEQTRITDANGTGSIFNDDFPVIFSSFNTSVTEGDEGDTNQATVTVTRSGETSSTATLDYSIDGFTSQAADNDDVVGTLPMTGTLTFGPGVTSQQITIDIEGDNVEELQEFLQVTFSNPTSDGGFATQLNTGSVTVTINNDDFPVFFSVGNASAIEGQSGDLTPLTFTVFRSGETNVEATVDYQFRAYAPSPSISAETQDFENGLPQTGTVTFAPGQTSAQVTFNVVDDDVFEGTEYAELLLSNPTADSHPQGAQITDDYGFGTIQDDEIPVYFRIYSDTVTEGDPGDTSTLSFLVQRTGDTSVDASVDYTVSTYYYRGATDPDLDEPPLPFGGTVSFAAGETQKFIEIDVEGDDLFEGTEYLQVDLSDPTSGNPDVLPAIINSRALGYIVDDDIPTYFRVNGYSVNEGDPGDANFVRFVVSRYGDTSEAASVDYEIGGGSTDALDFEAGAWPTSGTVNFAANQTSIEVLVPILEDDDIESDEYTLMTLSNPQSDDPAITAEIVSGTGYAYIRNDDFPANITVDSYVSVTEGDTASDARELVFNVYRSGDTSSVVSVDYDFAADSFLPVDAADFEGGLPLSGTVTFGVGSTQQTIRIAIAEDEEVEANERGRLTLSNEMVVSGAPDATVSLLRTSSIGVINNDDQDPSIEVQVNGSRWGTSVNEGNSGLTPVTITFLRDGNTTGDVEIEYNLNPLPSAGSVFAANSQDIDDFLPSFGNTITIPDGQSAVTTTVNIIGDGIIEANESFEVRIVSLTTPPGDTYDVTNAAATITIRNDDGRPPIPELPFDVDGDGVIEDGEVIRVEADIFGDPHITTLDGLGYDFQAVGEYVLVETQDGATNPFSVQVRFEAFPGSDLVSVTTRAAVEVEGSVVEVDALNPDAPLLIDGVAIDFAAAQLTGGVGDSTSPAADNIFIDEDGKIFITLNDAGELLMIGVVEGSLNVCVFLADPAAGGNAGNVQGLMGNANQDLSDDFSMRDGSDIPEDEISFDDDGVPALTFDFLYGFGDFEGAGYRGSWEVSGAEPIFSGDTPDFPEGFPAGPLKLDNLPQSVQDAARAAAEDAGLGENLPDGSPNPNFNAVIFENAALDFALTGMGAFLGGATQLAAEPEQQSLASEAPDVVPTVNITANQTMVTEGDDGTTEITFTVYRLGGSVGDLNVTYEIQGDVDAADLGAGTPLSGTIAFADGEDEQTLTIAVNGDLTTEMDEALQVVITGADDEGVLIGASQGETTVKTDDFGPEAEDDALDGEAGETITGNVIDDNGQGEDSDADDDELSVVSVIIDGEPLGIDDGPYDLGSGRMLEMDAEGNFSFMPGAFYNDLPAGEFAEVTFEYEVSDGNGGMDIAEVTLTIQGTATPNTPPVANDDDVTIEEDEGTYIFFLDNDEDADSDRLVESILTQPEHGTLVFDGEGYFYTPDDNYNGDDMFTYQISDGNGGTDTATVNITINPVNDGPTAVDDAGEGDEGESVLIDVLANDFDVDGDNIGIVASVSSGAAFGSVSSNTDGPGLIYTPNDPNFSGTDTFTYVISDGLEQATGTVTVTINPVNDAPEAPDLALETDEDTEVSGNVLDGATDVDNDAGDLFVSGATLGGVALTIGTATDLAAGGTLLVEEDGTVTFNPTDDYEALGFNPQPEPPADVLISLEVTISDGEDETLVPVSIGVFGANDEPALGETGPFDVAENTVEVGTITATDPDDGAELEFSITGGADADLFDIDASTGALTFKDAPDFEAPMGGEDDDSNTYEVQVAVSDGIDTADEFIFVNVTDVDEGPTLNPVTGTTGRDSLLGTDGDDLFTFNGGRGDVARDFGGADQFDMAPNLGNGARDITTIIGWSDDDLLIGMDLSDVNLETVRSSSTVLRFTYGPDNDILSIVGEVDGGVESLFGLDTIL